MTTMPCSEGRAPAGPSQAHRGHEATCSSCLRVLHMPHSHHEAMFGRLLLLQLALVPGKKAIKRQRVLNFEDLVALALPWHGQIPHMINNRTLKHLHMPRNTMKLCLAECSCCSWLWYLVRKQERDKGCSGG